MLLLPCFFLGAGAYWLNCWLLACVLLLVCLGDGCCGFELRSLVYILMGLWAWLGVGIADQRCMILMVMHHGQVISCSIMRFWYVCVCVFVIVEGLESLCEV